MKVIFSFNLTRLWKHYREGSFGIVSAYLYNLPKKENEKRSKDLKAQVRKMGYGYKEIRGVWKGDSGLTFEYPLFIPNIKPNEIKSLSKEFEQDAVLYSDTSEEVILWDTKHDKKIMTFEKIEVGGEEAWESYSELKGRKFRYSEVDWNIPFADPTQANSSRWAIGLAEDAYFKKGECDYTRDDEKRMIVTFKVKQKLKGK